MKKLIKNITLFILTISALCCLVACNEEGEPQEEAPVTQEPAATPEATPNKPTGQFPYDDMIERPEDIPPLADLEYVSYPAKPEDLEPGQGEGMPTIGTASTESEFYKIEQTEEKITIRFYEVGKWDYIYLPIENFNSEYQNIKITATASNVQKVAFTALYAEMYETGYPAVTALAGDVGDTEQYYIMTLGDLKVLDKEYYSTEQSLGDQTVFALCLFIDSIPSQGVANKKTSIESTFEITSIEFLKDDDPALEKVEVEPSVRADFFDAGYNLDQNASGKHVITKYANAGQWESASLAVNNYSSNFSAFNLKFSTTGVTTLTIELTVSGGLADWQPNVVVYKVTDLKDGEHEAYIDFSSVQPTMLNPPYDFVAGYFIKNYRISAIKFYLDTADASELVNKDATCVIDELKFDKVVGTDGTVISKGWNAGSSNIKLGEDLAVGGVGSVEYSWYNTWEYLTIPVLNYQTATKLTVQFQANDGIDYMGIALGCARLEGGEAVVKSCWDSVNTAVDKTEGVISGIVETVEYDAVNKIYTITFDFTNAVKLTEQEGKSVNELDITSLRFYFTDPNITAEFDGTRTIRFISIAFE